jgi:NADH dehydrogenase [ubiquinone] 1 alpha subcomplex assembly factor 1
MKRTLTPRRHGQGCNIDMKRAGPVALLLKCGLWLTATSSPGTEPPMGLQLDFAHPASAPHWIAVNDDVMGGLSRSAPARVDGHLQFRGTLSLANNGGFASIRTTGMDFDLARASAIVLRVRGDGRTYQVRLATDARHRGIRVSYGGGFATRAGQWIDVRVPFDALQPTVRGRRLDGPPFDPANAREIGLLIADRREGPFALDVAWLRSE